MNIDFWGDREARMIYIQFPIDDTSLISRTTEIFTRDSSAGRSLARVREQEGERRREGYRVRVRSREEGSGHPRPLWIWESMWESSAGFREENGTLKIFFCPQ